MVERLTGVPKAASSISAKGGTFFVELKPFTTKFKITDTVYYKHKNKIEMEKPPTRKITELNSLVYNSIFFINPHFV